MLLLSSDFFLRLFFIPQSLDFSLQSFDVLVMFGDQLLLGRDLFLDSNDPGSGRSPYAARHD